MEERGSMANSERLSESRRIDMGCSRAAEGKVESIDRRSGRWVDSMAS